MSHLAAERQSYIVKANNLAQVAAKLNRPVQDLQRQFNKALSSTTAKTVVLELSAAEVNLLETKGLHCQKNNPIWVPPVYQQQVNPDGKRSLTEDGKPRYVRVFGGNPNGVQLQRQQPANVRLDARPLNAGAPSFHPDNIVDGEDFEVPHNRATQTASGVHNLRNRKGYTGEGVQVVVVDTGYNNVGAAPGELPELVHFDKANTGWEEGPGQISDSGQHGTHVLGTIYAKAPKADFSAVRFLEQFGGSNAAALKSLAKAVEWYDQSRTDPNDPGSGRPMVINNSWGGPKNSTCSNGITAYIEDIRRTGRAIIFTAAAGNNSSEFDLKREGDNTGSPGCSTGVMTAAAMELNELLRSDGSNQLRYGDDNIFFFSSYSDQGRINVAGNGKTSSVVPGGEHATFAGTSMATPDISGDVAVLFGKIVALRNEGKDIPSPAELAAPIFRTGDDTIDSEIPVDLVDGWSMLEYFIYRSAYNNDDIPSSDEGTGLARVDLAAEKMHKYYGLDFGRSIPEIPEPEEEAGIF